MALAPVQAPEPVQAVALLDDQLIRALLPLWTVLGLAAKATVGAGWLTDTVVDWLTLPPVPVHVST